MPLPVHVAVIPDGNRRWAKKKGLPSFFGHRAGVKSVELLLKNALEIGIQEVTLWGCSVDNLTKRDAKEVAFLCALFERYFKKLTKNKLIHERGIRIHVLGAWRAYFSPNLRKVIDTMCEETKKYTNHHLTFLLAYSGIEEMVGAIKDIAALAKRDAKINIDASLVKEHLLTRQLSPVDLVIRTGGEPHFSSGFMMWDVADAQLYFTETLWPDFSREEFEKALARYDKTERRRGK